MNELQTVLAAAAYWGGWWWGTRMSGTATSTQGTPRQQATALVGIVDLFAQVVPLRPVPVERLMTFEELQQKIEVQPKKDRLGGLYKMSTRYKDLGRQLEQVQAKVRTLEVGDLDTPNSAWASRWRSASS